MNTEPGQKDTSKLTQKDSFDRPDTKASKIKGWKLDVHASVCKLWRKTVLSKYKKIGFQSAATPYDYFWKDSISKDQRVLKWKGEKALKITSFLYCATE